MDYRNKLKIDRYRISSVSNRDFNEEMESDRGRAITSAAVRRLQQKTQVFPLEKNAAVRSRLTHSLEVQQVGRYISKTILNELKMDNLLAEYSLLDSSEGFLSAVEIACLLHDIGNPPFGHFGEKAINIWVNQYVKPIFDEKFKGIPSKEKLVSDLVNFEGNAQGLRVLHSLQHLNLTYTQFACLLKYTRAAYEAKPSDESDFKYRKKKPGFYYSEKKLVNKIHDSLSINKGNRFPLTYIMEAADDISYCIADLDDAIDKKILSVDELHKAIKSTWDNFGQESPDVINNKYLPKIADLAYKKYNSSDKNKNHNYLLTLRTTLVNDLSKYAAKRYIDNHIDVFEGSFDESLLDGNDEYHYATETLRLVAVNNVFNTKEVENLELKGYSIISGLLNIYTPLLLLEYVSFKKLAQTNSLKDNPIETRLFHNLSEKHKTTYRDAVSSIFKTNKPSEIKKLLELYYRCRLIIDYISGMTDNFSLTEYQNLSAST